MDSWRKNPLVFWVISLPPTFWLVVFFLVPMSIVWVMSFGENKDIINIEITWTLKQYLRVFEDPYPYIFLKSFWFAGLTTLICLIVGFPVAFMITFAPNRWKGVLLLLIILPFWTNLLIRTYALIAVLRTRGFVNFALEDLWEGANWVLDIFGLGSYQLLGERFVALEILYNNFAVVYGLVFVHLPFMVLPLYASLERMDHSLVEASLDLGGSQLRTFFSVTVPLAKAGIYSGIVITFIPALGSFLTPDLLGGTDSQMIANVIESQFKSANNWPFGAALSFILMYVTFIALALRAVFARGSSAMEAG